MLKKRKAKASKRGVYLQDKELQQTVFKPGKHYKWIIDKKNKKLVILPSKEKGNIVSKRIKNNNINPVIDIRKQEVLSVFQDCEYLQIEIFKDQILVEGYIYDETVSIDTVKENRKVVNIKQLIRVKKKTSALISRKQLKKVVGELRTDESDWLFSQKFLEIPGNELVSIEDALNNVHIPLAVGSLFSGCGMADQGFIDAGGFDIVYAVEKDNDAATTYRYNIGNHVYVEDIRKIDKSLLPKVPIIFGGSPCQGFSNSNRISNFLENPNNLLVREYIKIIQANENVKVFVLENVPRILTAGDGKFLEEIQNELKDFEMTVGVLNAADFNVPQSRRRAVIIGSKIGKVDLPKPTVKHPKTVREAFIGLNHDIPNQMDVSVPQNETKRRMKYVPEGGNIFDIPESIRTKGTHSCMYKRLKWDEPACTLVNFRKSLIMPPHENRILSVREAARLFGVKDDFVFKGSLSSKQQQVANGIPTPMAKAIAMEVKNTFIRYFTRLKNAFRKNTLAIQ